MCTNVFPASSALPRKSVASRNTTANTTNLPTHHHFTVPAGSFAFPSADDEPRSKEKSMGDTHRDPTDHWRTTNSHTGVTFIDTYCWPGLVSIALGITSLVGCLAAAAYQDAEWVPMTGIVSVLATAG